MAKDGNDRVIARLPTAEELALAEFSKSEMLQSIDKITEFSKTMITLVSGFFVAYFALLKFLGLGREYSIINSFGSIYYRYVTRTLYLRYNCICSIICTSYKEKRDTFGPFSYATLQKPCFDH